jgi:hypothetical protein
MAWGVSSTLCVDEACARVLRIPRSTSLTFCFQSVRIDIQILVKACRMAEIGFPRGRIAGMMKQPLVSRGFFFGAPDVARRDRP